MPRKPKAKPIAEITPADLPDKPDELNAKHPLTRRKLGFLLEVEFPRDYAMFSGWERIFRFTPEGKARFERWCSQAGQTAGQLIAQPKLFLQLLQTDLLKAKINRLQLRLCPHFNPKWELALKEINPFRREALMLEAAKEEATTNATLSESAQKTYAQFVAGLSQREQHQDYIPDRPTIRLWFEPMTVADYVQATAISRRTINKFLKNHTPLNSQKSPFEPYRYGKATNFAVLDRWLTVWTRKSHKRWIHTACTLAICEARARPRVLELMKALRPVHRIIEAEMSFDQYMTALPQLIRHYTLPKEPPGLKELNAFISASVPPNHSP